MLAPKISGSVGGKAPTAPVTTWALHLTIIVPMARQGRFQAENENVDQFLMPRDSFTFCSRNKKGQLSNRGEHLSAKAKQWKTAQRG